MRNFYTSHYIVYYTMLISSHYIVYHRKSFYRDMFPCYPFWIQLCVLGYYLTLLDMSRVLPPIVQQIPLEILKNKAIILNTYYIYILYIINNLVHSVIYIICRIIAKFCSQFDPTHIYTRYLLPNIPHACTEFDQRN